MAKEMSLIESDPPDVAAPGIRRNIVMGTGVALLVFVGLCCLGTRLQNPGRSLVLPALIVGGVGVVPAVISWIVACFRPQRRELWILSILFTVLAACSSFWTFDLAMPVSLIIDSSSTQRARAALTAVGSSHHFRCTTVESGSIGPLRPPFQMCAYPDTGGKYSVIFTALTSSTDRGLSFTNFSTGDLQDQCSRHIEGEWWAFGGTTEVDNPGGCLIGYQFHGGG
jgi:hypothetical protein